ncbi:MAG: type II secretion system protein [Candidatus Pacebacteria bacterium]|jgi:prepilin-type N-terminal cleavage/methylation domain-containing protein|nr:type II secretion system protein [Candidatus Paceibacterota bacterium]|tara:strand:- start:208 stop:693 length:486 start_codon:yes stop_codon:yes gene_type:complete
MRKTENKGFTLIELLVVIAIIGILSSVVLTSLNSARQKSRDAKRIAELRQLQTALQLFYEDNQGYPSALTAANLVTPRYTPSIPIPPVGGGDTAYLYSPIGTGCTDYHIGVTLENENHDVLSGDINAAAISETNQCPDEASATAKTDFTSTDADNIYDLKP